MITRARGGHESGKRPPLLPWFAVAFFGFAVLTSLGAITPALQKFGSDLSTWCLVTAIGALGMKIQLRELTTVGIKPVLLMLGQTVFLAAWCWGCSGWAPDTNPCTSYEATEENPASPSTPPSSSFRACASTCLNTGRPCWRQSALCAHRAIAGAGQAQLRRARRSAGPCPARHRRPAHPRRPQRGRDDGGALGTVCSGAVRSRARCSPHRRTWRTRSRQAIRLRTRCASTAGCRFRAVPLAIPEPTRGQPKRPARAPSSARRRWRRTGAATSRISAGRPPQSGRGYGEWPQALELIDRLDRCSPA